MESSPPRNLDHAGNSTTIIPFDLAFEILSKLPTKSIIRFQSVSKLWFSIIRSKDFVDSFLARSKTRPRLFFTFNHSLQRFIFSAPDKHNSKDDDDDKASTVMARHDMTISDYCGFKYGPVNGFICCTSGYSIAVCNPTTRQIVKLPAVEYKRRDMFVRLGYDPVEDQYKVLCVMMFNASYSTNIQGSQQEHFVFTLSSQQKEYWRKIENTTGDTYPTVAGGICIDGAIYYGDGRSGIVRFDVRYEKLELIEAPEESLKRKFTLLNHNGKLGIVDYNYNGKIVMWILENAEKHEWSDIMTCGLASEWSGLVGDYKYYKGEINMVVNSRLQSYKSCSVWYYDFNKQSIRKVEVEGIADEEFRRVHKIGNNTPEILSFPGYVENIRFLSTCE